MTAGAPLTTEAIAHALASYAPRDADSQGLRDAAVLVPLTPTATGIAVRFIVRPHTMSTHAGQVAFPGGGRDPGDVDTLATALRETHEELGIPAAAITPLGRLDHLPTISNFHVTPWVGWVAPDTPLCASPAEVAHTFLVPLDALSDPNRVRTMRGRWWPRGRGHRLHFYLADSHTIWGATAAVLTNLLAVLAEAGLGQRLSRS